MRCSRCDGEGCAFCNQSGFVMARPADPPTSHKAAKRHVREGLSERRQQVLGLVTRFPGLTAGEYSRKMALAYPELSMSVCAETPHKRLPELESLGHVKRGPERACSESRYQRETWFPV